MSPRAYVCARCPAAGSIRQALNRAISLVCREFSLPRASHPLERGDCSALRALWSSRKAALLLEVGDGLRRRALKSSLKSCDRFFDVPCKPCDKRDASKASREWVASVTADPAFDPARPVSWSDDPIVELTRRVRNLVGRNWARKLPSYRDHLIPDQNGCLEEVANRGGSLAVAQNEYSSDRWGLRVGVAKTKGKFRTVTMQSARVKEILRPVHECFYDRLSRERWLVRGDVTKEHVRAVVDGRLPGENFISGDYEAATNNIYVQVPWTIAQVLAESPHLSEEEREALLESYRPENLHGQFGTCRSAESFPILRGSMMGNLMSFPMLCVLNKVCYDICCDLRYKRDRKLRLENVIINGDDIAFAGDSQFYDDWVSVTSFFGLKVNLEKTEVSSEFVDLNSRTFQVCPTGRIEALRKPVLSALQPLDDPSCLLTRLWDGLRTLSPGSFRWMVIMLRHHIIRRGVNLSSIPLRMRRVFVKMAWFRRAILTEPIIIEKGAHRAWRVVTSDLAPPDELRPFYDDARVLLDRFGVRWARGIKARPFETRLAPGMKGSSADLLRGPGRKVFHFHRVWSWRWPAPLMWLWRRFDLPFHNLRHSELWESDHPDLSTQVIYSITSVIPRPPCPRGCEPFGGGHSVHCLSG